MRRCCLRFITLMLGVTQYESPLGTGAVLVAARVARALHTTSLSDYLLIFFCFNKHFVFFTRQETILPLPPLLPKKKRKFEKGHHRGSQIWLKATEKTFFSKTAPSGVSKVRFY